MTSAETAMIPVSRRTIASAIAALAVPRQRLEVEALELALGGPGPRRLGEQRDERPAARRRRSGGRRRPRGRAAAGRADRDLDDDRDLGDPQRVPEADRRLAAQPGDAAPDAGDEVGDRTAMPTIRWTVAIRSERRPLEGRIPLVDAENTM